MSTGWQVLSDSMGSDNFPSLNNAIKQSLRPNQQSKNKAICHQEGV